MDSLNYHHLRYFWVVAREGSIALACEVLQLTQPCISKQIHQLERSLGDKLFRRVGRNLALTERGQLVFRYADEIFSLGRELTDVLSGRPSETRLRLLVGVPDVLPKLVAYRLLEPALHLPEPVQIVCDENYLDYLLAELAAHRLDLVLSDAPMTPTVSVRAYNHLLGECSVSIFGAAKLARKLRAGFPKSLDGAPLLLPMQRTLLRRSLEQWFDSESLRPVVVGEFADSALLKSFGQAGVGVFPAPSVIEKQVCRQYGSRVIGRIDAVRERYYAISLERRLKHPAVVAISGAARRTLFD